MNLHKYRKHSFEPTLSNIIQIACGSEHSICINSIGDIFTFGYNKYGQLGTGDLFNKYVPTKITVHNMLTKQISCGSCHTLVLDNIGNVYGFGSNDNGQLGLDKQKIKQAIKISFVTDIIEICATSNRTLALTSDRDVYSCGTNYDDCLNLGKVSYCIHTPIKLPSLKNITHICAGISHTLLLDKENILYSYGDNSYGQLSNNVPL